VSRNRLPACVASPSPSFEKVAANSHSGLSMTRLSDFAGNRRLSGKYTAKSVRLKLKTARIGASRWRPRGNKMKLKIEMTLTAEAAKRLKETGERLAVMNLGDDGLLAAVILMRIAADYERARQGKAAGTIPLENLNVQNED
jgi:hypothetical protein